MHNRSLDPRQRIKSLDAVRAMAALSVFLYHLVRALPEKDGVLYLFCSTALGPWGVSVFFVLSGFVLSYSYWNRAPNTTLKSSFNFMIGKMSKLYPLYILMLIVGLSASIVNAERSIAEILISFIVSVPLLQSWFPNDFHTINTVAWFLSTLMFLQFCFPVILKFVKRIDWKQAVWISIAVWIVQIASGFFIATHFERYANWLTYRHPIYRLGDFFVGTMIFSVYSSRRNLDANHSQIRYTALEVFALCFSIALCLMFGTIRETMNWFAHTAMLLPASALLVYVFALDRGKLSALLTNAVALWLSRMSSYIFLIHYLLIIIVLEVIKMVFHFEITNYFISAVLTFVLTVFSVYVYLFFESKIQRLRNKR